MAKIRFRRVPNLSGTLNPNTIYFVKEPGNETFKFYITNSSSIPVPLDAVSEADLPGGQVEYRFDTSSTEWVVNHNLNKKPDPLVFVNDHRVYTGIVYVDNNTLKITFKNPQVGYVLVS